MGTRGVLRTMGEGMVGFRCPGCKHVHAITIAHEPGETGPIWGFNGDYDKPTFTPSILTKSGHYVSSHKPGDPCWCDFEQRMGRKVDFKCSVCHSFVTDGRIQFLSDCTHELAGQTVALVPEEG